MGIRSLWKSTAKSGKTFWKKAVRSRRLAARSHLPGQLPVTVKGKVRQKMLDAGYRLTEGRTPSAEHATNISTFFPKINQRISI
jgi:hypothetical protein